MKLQAIVLSIIIPSLVVGIAGCDTSKMRVTGENKTATVTTDHAKANHTATTNAVTHDTTTNDTTNSIALQTTNSNDSTSNTAAETTALEQSFGWRYVEIPTSFGASSQIGGIDSLNGNIQMTIISEQTTGNSIQNEYATGTYQLDTNQLSDRQESTKAPNGYKGSWKLTFGRMNGQQPVTMTLVGNGTSIPIPSSIPAYVSEINPAPADPGNFDNRILGQTGDWVWIAMKGPGDPPMPGLVWGYRQWNRILAINTKSRETQVFSIPRRTSETDTWNNTPGFAVIGDTVYVATGNWVGTFPAAPTNQSSITIRVPEPQSVVAADQAKMLNTLSDLETEAATGIAGYWNNYVMKGNEKATNDSWIGDPAVYNHGDYPPDLYWALNFPLKSGTQAYNQRAALVREIEQLLKSPLTMAWVAYPDPSSMRAHFQSTPPTAIPGYHIVNGYYVKG